MTLSIVVDESLGRSGIIKLSIPDDPSVNLGVLNIPFSFKTDNSTVSCRTQAGSAGKLRYCTFTNSRQVELYLTDEAFVLAGDTVTIVLEGCCMNPSSLYFKQKTFWVSTHSPDGRLIEERKTHAYLKSLNPAEIVKYSVVHGSTRLGKESTTFGVYFTTINAIPSGGKIQIKFPKRL